MVAENLAILATLVPTLIIIKVLRAMQVAHDVLPEQQLWSAKSPPLARDALHDFLRKATAVAPILPGTIVFLRARTDGTWGDGCDKARPGRGGGSRRSSGGSGSRSTRSTQANRFRWGLVTEPPVSVSPSHTPDGSIANTMMRGVGEGVGMTTDSSALPPAGIKGAAAMAEVVWIANPSGEFEAPFSIDRWRVVNRDFQEDAMQALSEAAGRCDIQEKGCMLSYGRVNSHTYLELYAPQFIAYCTPKAAYFV